MQFLTLTNFTAFIALVSNVHATCYKTGIVGDKAIVANGEAGVNTACRALVGPNGSLGPKESRRVCIQVSGSTRWDFKLRHKHNGYRAISVQECVDGLAKEVNNCDKGGSSSYENWSYSSDPNRGQCLGF